MAGARSKAEAFRARYLTAVSAETLSLKITMDLGMHPAWLDPPEWKVIMHKNADHCAPVCFKAAEAVR